MNKIGGGEGIRETVDIFPKSMTKGIVNCEGIPEKLK